MYVFYFNLDARTIFPKCFCSFCKRFIGYFSSEFRISTKPCKNHEHTFIIWTIQNKLNVRLKFNKQCCAYTRDASRRLTTALVLFTRHNIDDPVVVIFFSRRFSLRDNRRTKTVCGLLFIAEGGLWWYRTHLFALVKTCSHIWIQGSDCLKKSR